MAEAPAPPPDLRKPPDDDSPIEEMAREKLGLNRWDRPTLFRETADAAIDTDLPFWMVLLLSGAIATLGLLLDQSAVVIGAMLVAPLLGPLLGLSMALAIGDARLAAMTFTTLLLGILGVIAVAAALTMLLPFNAVTAEISARTRPTTLDLAIAVFSGLAGAVVTVSREKRLSASIPGVAIAVALIPPLSVAGFGIGTGWNGPLIKGSLLLFGANLGGIVLSGMLAFLLVGMHRDDVRAAARKWHERETQTVFIARLISLPFFRRLRVFDTPWARVALVAAFVGAVSVPLSSSLGQVLRESRVNSALANAADALDNDTASVLSREITLGESSTLAEFRIATTEWISDETRRTVEKEASAAAGEPVTLRLEQILASQGDLQALADRIPNEPPPEASGDPQPPALDPVRTRVADALAALALPDSVAILGGQIGVGDGPPALTVVYAARQRLAPETEAVIARQAAQALDLPASGARTRALVLGPRPVPADSAGAARLASGVADLASRYPEIGVVVTADSAGAASLRQRLARAGLSPDRLTTRAGSPPRLSLTLQK